MGIGNIIVGTLLFWMKKTV